MTALPAPARYAAAILAAHAAFRALAGLGYAHTDTKGRISLGPASAA